MKYYIPILFLLVCWSLLPAQKLSYRQACEDIDFYLDKIDSIHPNMYWHTPKTVVDSFRTMVKEQCRDSVDVEELRFLLSRGNHFWDYHTGISNVWNEYYIWKCDSVFPKVKITPEGVFLKENGRRILSVNKRSVTEIIACARSSYGQDLPEGYTLPDMEMFLEFQYALMFMEIYPPYMVETSINGKDSLMEAYKVSYWDLKTEAMEAYENFNDSGTPYSFEIHPDSSVAIIRYNRCVGEQDTPAFSHFLKSSFEQVNRKKIRSLFIDISRNGGGHGYTNDMLLSYLHRPRSLHTKFRWQKKVMLPKNRWKIENIRESLEYPKSEGYQGNIFIYQSPFTLSSGTELSIISRLLGIWKIVGTNTENVNNKYIDCYYFELPNSGIKFGVPFKHILSYSDKIQITNDEGQVVPDIPYPFLTERRLNLDDCMKIIELEKQRKAK